MTEFKMYRPPKKCNRCGIPIARNTYCEKCRVKVNRQRQELRWKRGLPISDVEVRCRVCGRYGHRPITCPLAPPPPEPKLCGRCRQRGHEEKDCTYEWGEVIPQAYASRALAMIDEADEAMERLRKSREQNK